MFLPGLGEGSRGRLPPGQGSAPSPPKLHPPGAGSSSCLHQLCLGECPNSMWSAEFIPCPVSPSPAHRRDHDLLCRRGKVLEIRGLAVSAKEKQFS